MSFFNLTMLGYNDPVRSNTQRPAGGPQESGSTQPTQRRLVSSKEFNELKKKHARDTREPHQIYTKPMTTSQEVSWWTKDQPINQTLPWTHVKKHVFPKSEMTAFVDEMVINDKSFKMY